MTNYRVILLAMGAVCLLSCGGEPPTTVAPAPSSALAVSQVVSVQGLSVTLTSGKKVELPEAFPKRWLATPGLTAVNAMQLGRGGLVTAVCGEPPEALMTRFDRQAVALGWAAAPASGSPKMRSRVYRKSGFVMQVSAMTDDLGTTTVTMQIEAAS